MTLRKRYTLDEWLNFVPEPENFVAGTLFHVTGVVCFSTAKKVLRSLSILRPDAVEGHLDHELRLQLRQGDAIGDFDYEVVHGCPWDGGWRDYTPDFSRPDEADMVMQLMNAVAEGAFITATATATAHSELLGKLTSH